MRNIKLFISSPGDVAQEREICRRVLARLNREFSGRAQLTGYFWEYEPMEITRDYQEQIPPPSTFDIFVCILWSRLGSRLHSRYQLPDGRPCRSGTEFEFVDAIEGRRRNKDSPDIMVWVNKTQPLIPLEPEKDYEQRIEQWRLLKAFLEEWTRDNDEGVFKGAVNSYRRLDKFEETFEIKLRKLIERRLGDDAPTGLPAVQWTTGSPYRGLEAFDRRHADVFFGRTAAIEEVLDAVRRQQEAGSGLVLVLGASGSGKSSLVHAGVLPLLTTPGVIEGIGLWREAFFRPSLHGGNLLAGLAAALLEKNALADLADPEVDDPVGELRASLKRQPESVAESVRLVLNEAARAFHHERNARLQEHGRQLETAGRVEDAAAIAKRVEAGEAPRARLVLAIDQFEELFTGDIGSEETATFLRILMALARGGRVVVLATLRSDFYHHLQETPELIELAGTHGKIDLLPPQAHEIGQIIREPARMAGLVFERDPLTGVTLDEVLRDAALESPEALPLLEHGLDQLYQAQAERGDRVLRFADYEAMGKLDGALARHADAVFDQRSPKAQKAFDQVFRSLVTLGRDEPIPVRRTALQSRLMQDEGARELVEAFVDQRLFTSDQTASGEPVVSVAHESLLRVWERARQWIATNQDFLAIRARVGAACAQWEASSRDPSFLLQAGRQLAEAEDGFQRHPEAFSPEESAFIAASRDRLAEAEGRKRRLRRVVMASMALLTILAVLGFLDARQGRLREEAAAKRESEARQRAEATVDTAAAFLLDLLGTNWVGRLQEKDLLLTEEFLESSDGFVQALGSGEQSLALLEAWAKSMASLAGSLQGQGKVGEAIEVQQRAVEVQERIAAAVPDHPVVQTHLATQRYALGQLYRISQEPREAEAVFETALAKLDAAMKRIDTTDRMREMWLALQNALSATFTQHGNPEEGEARFEETVRRLKDWADAGAGEHDWEAVLADTWMRRADAKVMVNANDEAEEALRQAEQVVENLDTESGRQEYAKGLLQSWASLETNRGNFARAAALYAEWDASEEANPAGGPVERLQTRCAIADAWAQALFRAGEVEKAIATAERGLITARELADIDESNLNYRQPLCGLLSSLGLMAETRFLWETSEKWYRQAYVETETLLRNDPSGHHAADLLTLSGGRSRALTGLNRPEEAMAVLQAAQPYAVQLERLIREHAEDYSVGLWKRQLAMYFGELAPRLATRSPTPEGGEEALGAYDAAIRWSEGQEILAGLRETWVRERDRLSAMEGSSE